MRLELGPRDLTSRHLANLASATGACERPTALWEVERKTQAPLPSPSGECDVLHGRPEAQTSNSPTISAPDDLGCALDISGLKAGPAPSGSRSNWSSRARAGVQLTSPGISEPVLTLHPLTERRRFFICGFQNSLSAPAHATACATFLKLSPKGV